MDYQDGLTRKEIEGLGRIIGYTAYVFAENWAHAYINRIATAPSPGVAAARLHEALMHFTALYGDREELKAIDKDSIERARKAVGRIGQLTDRDELRRALALIGAEAQLRVAEKSIKSRGQTKTEGEKESGKGEGKNE